MRRWIAVVTVVGVLALALAAGGLWAGFSGVFSASQPSSDPTTAPSDQLQSSDSAKVGTTPAPTQRAGEHQSLSRLSLQQKVGQVVMASVPVTGADPAALTEFADLQVGNVFLRGSGYDGVTAVRAVSDSTVAPHRCAQQWYTPFLGDRSRGRSGARL